MTRCADRRVAWWKRECREQEAFNFALFQHSPAALTVVDREGRVLKSNLARRDSTLGLPALGEPAFPDSGSTGGVDLQAALMDAMRSRRVRRFPEQRIGNSIFSVTLAPFPHGAIVVCEDVTDRMTAQQQARIHEQQLMQADKMVTLGTLVSGVAHEVSNPNNAMLLSASTMRKALAGILGVLDRCARKERGLQVSGRPYREVRAQVLDQVEVVARAAERIRNLVDDLKDFARRDEGEFAELVDVNRVVQNAVRLLAPLIRKATRRFSLQCARRLPRVRGNAGRLEQVVLNLVTNACQALPDATKAIGIRTAYDGEKRCIVVEVQDEGTGIRPEHLSRVKDPFFTTRQDEGGTGLGLSVSDRIVTTHGGTLEFASVEGQGTTVTVRLPRAQPVPRGGAPREGQRSSGRNPGE